jgi:hypothetical protein
MLRGYWATPQMLESIKDRVENFKQCYIGQHHRCWGALRIGLKASNNAKRILGNITNVGESIGSVERMSNNVGSIRQCQKEVR